MDSSRLSEATLLQTREALSPTEVCYISADFHRKHAAFAKFITGWQMIGNALLASYLPIRLYFFNHEHMNEIGFYCFWLTSASTIGTLSWWANYDFIRLYTHLSMQGLADDVLKELEIIEAETSNQAQISGSASQLGSTETDITWAKAFQRGVLKNFFGDRRALKGTGYYFNFLLMLKLGVYQLTKMILTPEFSQSNDAETSREWSLQDCIKIVRYAAYYTSLFGTLIALANGNSAAAQGLLILGILSRPISASVLAITLTFGALGVGGLKTTTLHLMNPGEKLSNNSTQVPPALMMVYWLFSTTPSVLTNLSSFSFIIGVAFFQQFLKHHGGNAIAWWSTSKEHNNRLMQEHKLRLLRNAVVEALDKSQHGKLKQLLLSLSGNQSAEPTASTGRRGSDPEPAGALPATFADIETPEAETHHTPRELQEVINRIYSTGSNVTATPKDLKLLTTWLSSISNPFDPHFDEQASRTAMRHIFKSNWDALLGSGVKSSLDSLHVQSDDLDKALSYAVNIIIAVICLFAPIVGIAYYGMKNFLLPAKIAAETFHYAEVENITSALSLFAMWTLMIGSIYPVCLGALEHRASSTRSYIPKFARDRGVSPTSLTFKTLGLALFATLPNLSNTVRFIHTNKLDYSSADSFLLMVGAFFSVFLANSCGIFAHTKADNIAETIKKAEAECKAHETTNAHKAKELQQEKLAMAACNALGALLQAKKEQQTVLGYKWRTALSMPLSQLFNGTIRRHRLEARPYYDDTDTRRAPNFSYS